MPDTVCVGASPKISVSPISIDYGLTESPGSSTVAISVSNTGNADLTINSVSINGTNANEFTQTNNCTRIAPSTSCAVDVTFTPGSLGAKNATLSIASSDTNTPTVLVPLAGTGVDTIPPATTSSVAGKKGNNDWYVSDVSIALTATDSGSRVKEIYYSIDGGAEVVTAGGSASASLTTDGTHSFTYYAIDNAGNKEAVHTLSIKIDKTPPTITASTPTANAYGWNNTNVTVTFTCNDATSGVASCTGPITVTTEGANQVITGTAVDNAGNTATASVTLNIDKTPPLISSLSASPSILWPPNHKMVDVAIGGRASDSLSDVASIVITVTDEYGVYNMTVPGFGSTIQLEAWREGTDRDGRHYTITAVITDKAGNSSTATTSVLVPHDMK